MKRLASTLHDDAVLLFALILRSQNETEAVCVAHVIFHFINFDLSSSQLLAISIANYLLNLIQIGQDYAVAVLAAEDIFCILIFEWA